MSFRPSATAIKFQVEAALAHKIPSALTPSARPLPETIATGITALDTSIGHGIARGAVTEICGPASSGRTSVLLSLLATVTQRQEAVALVDARDAFHPESAAHAGVDLKRLLWVRCNRIAGSQDRGTAGWKTRNSKQNEIPQFGNPAVPQSQPPRAKERLQPVEQALKVTDLLLQSGGFGLIVVDLGDVRAEDARRVPLTTWFRFRRAIENTPSALVILEPEPYAKTCASLVMELRLVRTDWSAQIAELQNGRAENPNSAAPQSHCARPLIPTHAHLLHGLQIEVAISRGQCIAKKPVQSVPTFETQTNLSIC